jgi:hypothetical protein
VFNESIFPFAQLHLGDGARYTYDVRLLPDDMPRASSDSLLNNIHTNACLSPTILWSSQLMQPQMIQESPPATTPGTDPEVATATASAVPPSPTRVATDPTSSAPIGGLSTTVSTVGSVPPRHDEATTTVTLVTAPRFLTTLMLQHLRQRIECLLRHRSSYLHAYLVQTHHPQAPLRLRLWGKLLHTPSCQLEFGNQRYTWTILFATATLLSLNSLKIFLLPYLIHTGRLQWTPNCLH